MTDYIKRENAKRAVWGCARDTGIDEAPFEYAEGLLEDVPYEDVAPVRHGRWVENDYLFLDTLYRCSVCGEEFYLENGTPQENQYYYCPNCGAKMDGENDE